MGAFTLAGLLYIGAALAVLPVVATMAPNRRTLRTGATRLAVAVVVGGAAGPVFLAAGLSQTPAATASLLLNLELVFTVILAALFFREHLGSRVKAGTALVVVGGVVLGWSSSAEVRVGALLIGAACLCWAVDNCVTAALDELAPAHITFVKGVVAGGANLAIGLALGGAPSGWRILASLLVGAFGYGLSITLWVAGARDLGAARAQLVFATAPFVGAFIAWSVFTDPITGREVISLAIAAIGVSFVLRSDHLHEHTHDVVQHDHEHTHDDGHHRHSHEPGPPLRHRHAHEHTRLVHAHPHVPDIHHRHEHVER